METTGGGILGRLGEKVLGWVALALLILIGIAIWRMDPVLRTAIWQGIWRTIFWIAIAATLPWSARFFIRRILEVGSNWAGVGLLAALTVVDLGAGLLLLSGCDVTVEAKRVAVASEPESGAQQEELSLPTVSPSADMAGIVREKLADVAEGAGDVAKKAAERLRGGEDEEASEAETDATAVEADATVGEPDRGHSGWVWFAGLAALALAGTYNYLVTEYLCEVAGG
ncbi:MAG: hypothetical protein ACE5I3_01130 [Phycisphaerae bacterium]